MQIVDTQHIATFKILYAEYPQDSGDCFIEIRQQETAGNEQVELIVEHGQMDMLGDVVTTSTVVPFHFTVRQVLEWLNS